MTSFVIKRIKFKYYNKCNIVISSIEYSVHRFITSCYGNGTMCNSSYKYNRNRHTEMLKRSLSQCDLSLRTSIRYCYIMERNSNDNANISTQCLSHCIRRRNVLHVCEKDDVTISHHSFVSPGPSWHLMSAVSSQSEVARWS